MNKPPHIHPPKWPLQLLRFFIKEAYLEEIEGDMEEEFQNNLEQYSARKARWLYAWEVFFLFRPAFIKPIKINHPSIQLDMFRHNLILTYRVFKRYKSTFFINLIGLSTGLAAVFLIYLWVNDEIAMDKFHDKDSRVYQVMRNRNDNTPTINTKNSQSGLLAPALKEAFPEVENVVPVNFSWDWDGILTTGEKNIKAKGLLAGKDFFNVFSFPLVEGNAGQVLQGVNSIVLSDELAVKLFGSVENILNREITLDHEEFGGLFNISGIFKKSGYRSSEEFDFLLSNAPFFTESNSNWISNNVQVFLTLKENADPDQFNAKIKGFVRSKVQLDYEPEGLDWIGTLFIRPYAEQYLYGRYENGIQSGGRIDYVILFSFIGLLLLLIACINFMNLSTARASRRLKEIGIKKAIGANRKTLIFQYLGESIAMAFLSLPVAALIVMLCLPQFNEITNKQLSLGYHPDLLLTVLGITFFTGIIAGSYPALYLSGFRPVNVLKGKLDVSFGEIWARRGLVVLQFALSIIFIVSVLVIYRQMEFVQSKNLGYNRDNILCMEKEGKAMIEGLETFLEEVKNMPGVVNVASYSSDVLSEHDGTWGLDWEGKGAEEGINFSGLVAGYNFIETLGIEMASGRTFSPEFGSDSSSIIFNEVAIKKMGLTNPIGQIVKLFGEEKQIVGVTKNFHFESLYEEVKPCFFVLESNNPKVMIKIKAGTERETIGRIEAFHRDYRQGVPFNFTFLDEDYQALYASEQRVAVLSKYFTGIAILISCLGLFGLAVFTAESRLKEIGIRKILGATVFGIVRLLSTDFTRMVLVAILIALPIAYFIMKNWLADFAFRIDLQWWFFAGAAVLALFIAWITIGIQTIKVARVNPVQCLRDE